MTAGLSEQQATSSALDSATVRTVLAGLALAAGVVVAWLGGSVVLLGLLAVIVAVSNGYRKAYSP